MKHNLLLLSLAAIAIFGCKKNETGDPAPKYFRPQPYNGIVTAFRNGQPWIANAYAGNRHSNSGTATDRFMLFMDHYEKYGADSNLRNYLVLDYLRYEPYKTDLAGDSAFSQPSGIESIRHVNYIGSDVLDPPSSLLKSEPHWIEIATFDPSSGQISGTFAATFVSMGNKDTLRFTNGFFTARIYP